MVPKEWFDKTKKTPDIPLGEFLVEYRRDDTIYWRLACGLHKQLFDKVVQALVDEENAHPDS